MVEDCIFCKIIRKELAASIIHEDEDTLAFLDIHPVTPIHFLLIPKLHIDALSNIDNSHQQLMGKMMCLIPKLAAAQGCKDGFRTIINTGRVGGQEVAHFHIHIISGNNRLPAMIKND